MKFVVVGASQGLGFELTRLLLENGHSVAAGTVEKEPPKALSELKGDLKVFPADVTDEGQIAAFSRECSSLFGGKADAVCVVAGVLLAGDRVNLIQDCDVAELRKTFDVNVIGPIIVGKYFYPLVKDGGKVFFVTSEGTGFGSVGTWVPLYALSKTAATKTALVFRKSAPGATFFAVHPGRMNTEMGRTTAQIEPEESARGFVKLMTGEKAVDDDLWYIDYNGNNMNV